MAQLSQDLKHERWLPHHDALRVATALGSLLPGLALVGVDASKRVVLWSAEAERLFGRPREDVLGVACPGGVVCDIGSEAPRPFGGRAAIARGDGNQVIVRHYTHVFRDPQGEVEGSLHLFAPEVHSPEVLDLSVPPGTVDFHGMISRDPAMLQIFDVIRRVAATEVTVLVRGESGTGKELVARALHAESPRRGGPFVAINCAAIAPTLLESELFGHRKGAFTGAHEDRQGIFAVAHGGTLFLDEVAELAPELQARLLRVLEDGMFTPVGGSQPQRADVRVVAATHRALREEVRAGRFREDLMYRLRVVPMFIPPLRERRLDIDLLLRHFLARGEGGRRVSRVSPEAMHRLLGHAWPGNVRELRNVVAYALAVGQGPELRLEDLPPELRDPRPPRPPAAPVPAPEDEVQRIRAALAETGGDLGAAASRLGMSRSTLWRRRRALGIEI